jgi:hypothetical protein
MPFTITALESTGSHMWGIAVATCNLEDDGDKLVATIVDLIRKSYGEQSLIQDVEVLLSEDINSGIFELKYLQAALRESLPDPDREGKKPVHLTNYRSQTAEMIAKAALAKVYNYQYPVSPQVGTPNPNQPIQGFDGWGIVETSDGLPSLALIQVKATDSVESPPDVSNILAKECLKAPKEKQFIVRALSIMFRHMSGDPLRMKIAKMLEILGHSDGVIPILVSPVIVRGITNATANDFEPITGISGAVHPACIQAIAVSIGADLGDFGYLVMNKAREVI